MEGGIDWVVGFFEGGVGKMGEGVSVEGLKVIETRWRRHHRRKYGGSPIF